MALVKYNYTYEQKRDIALTNTDRKDDDEEQDIITHDQMISIMRVLMFGVTPVISIFGITGNIFSIIILLKHGLHKCSNILLISLAVSDLTFLVAFNSPPKILYDVVGIHDGYGYNRDVSMSLYVLYQFFNFLDYTCSYISITMPMLITFERLVAVYLPFKFNFIITPTRTWCAVAVVYIFWFSNVLYMSFWWTFSYSFNASYISVGRMERSTLYNNNLKTVEALGEAIDYIGERIPHVATLVGCIFISVKVWIACRQRQRMTQSNSKDSSSNRTTKMLLAVCVVYMATGALLILPALLPEYMRHNIYGDAQSNLGPVAYQVVNIVLCINSSANFIVYVVMNRKFRDTYKSLFTITSYQGCNSCFIRISTICLKSCPNEA